MTDNACSFTSPILLSNPAVPTAHGRTLAVLASGCAIAHLPMIADHLATAPVLSSAMALLTLICAVCARKLWLSPSTQDCAVAAALAALMVLLHLVLMSSASAANPAFAEDLARSPHHHPAAPADGMAGAHDAVHTAGDWGGSDTLLYLATGMAVLQVALNWLAVSVTVRRLHRQTGITARPSRPPD